MTASPNFGWPLPDPQGNQQPEIQRIADALGLADEQVKALADLVAALTFQAIGGVASNEQLPARLTRQVVTDWNEATEAGNYVGSGADNAPPAALIGTGGSIYGRVDSYQSGETASCMQTAWPGPSGNQSTATTNTCIRFARNGVWSEWALALVSKTEISAQIASQINAAIAGLVDNAPDAINTLNELAAALGDDPNFAATISAQIGSKLPASAYTAADVLAKLKSVDGPSSGISVTEADNATKLGGKQLSDFLLKSGGAISGDLSISGSLTVAYSGGINFNNNDWLTFSDTGVAGGKGTYSFGADDVPDGADLAANALRLASTNDVSGTSTDHAFQIGASSGTNLRMDGNEILCVDADGNLTTLYLNNGNGPVEVGGTLKANGGKTVLVAGDVDDRVTSLRRASDGSIETADNVDGSYITINLPNGAFMTGFKSENESGKVDNLYRVYYAYLQGYSPAQGWFTTSS